jgi:hypothetical protein
MNRGQNYKIIMTNEKPTFEQLCDPAYRRAELVSEKSGAVWTAFIELDGMINKSKISEVYFKRSGGWFSQKLNGCTVCDRQRSFSEAEYHQLAEAFRHIARRLEAHADEIDAAAMDAPDDNE